MYEHGRRKSKSNAVTQHTTEENFHLGSWSWGARFFTTGEFSRRYNGTHTNIHTITIQMDVHTRTHTKNRTKLRARADDGFGEHGHYTYTNTVYRWFRPMHGKLNCGELWEHFRIVERRCVVFIYVMSSLHSIRVCLSCFHRYIFHVWTSHPFFGDQCCCGWTLFSFVQWKLRANLMVIHSLRQK